MMKFMRIILSLVFVSAMSFASDMRLDFARSTISIYNSKDFQDKKNKENQLLLDQEAEILNQIIKNKNFKLKLKAAQDKARLEVFEINKDTCAKAKIAQENRGKILLAAQLEKSRLENLKLEAEVQKRQNQELSGNISPISITEICTSQTLEKKSFPMRNFKIGNGSLFWGFYALNDANEFKIVSVPKMKSCLKKESSSMQEVD